MIDDREPLPSGAIITMPNGGKYEIDKLIARGGYSLVYSVYTPDRCCLMAIKEFFPCPKPGKKYAYRFHKEDKKNEREEWKEGDVVPVNGQEHYFKKHLERFNEEAKIGEKMSRKSSQMAAILQCGDRYALMRIYSEDMCKLSQIVKIWDDEKAARKESRVKSIEINGKPIPIIRYLDIKRVRNALKMTESLLQILRVMHGEGYLHLDISNDNVLWAGQYNEENFYGEAFLTDFGESVKMEGGRYYPTDKLAANPQFAAPEVRGNSTLTVATDIYSVGVLLGFLCCGSSSLRKKVDDEKKFINRLQEKLESLKIKSKPLGKLKKIIYDATRENALNRYDSAEDMLREVRDLRRKIEDLPYGSLSEAMDFNVDIASLRKKYIEKKSLQETIDLFREDEKQEIVCVLKKIREASDRVDISNDCRINSSVKEFFDNPNNWNEYMIQDELGEYYTISAKRPDIDRVISKLDSSYIWNDLLYMDDDQIRSMSYRDDSMWISFDINSAVCDCDGGVHTYVNSGLRIKYEYDSNSNCFIVNEFQADRCRFRCINLDWKQEDKRILFQCGLSMENCVLSNSKELESGVLIRNISFDFSGGRKAISFRDTRIVGGMKISKIMVIESKKHQSISFEDSRITGNLEIVDSSLGELSVYCFQTVFDVYLSDWKSDNNYALLTEATPATNIRMQDIKATAIILDEIEMPRGEIQLTDLSIGKIKICPYYTEVNRGATDAYINVKLNGCQCQDMTIGNVNLQLNEG